MRRSKLPAGIDSAAVRQPRVQERDVRSDRWNAVKGIGAAGGLTDHHEIRGRAQQVSQTATHQVVIVEQEDPDAGWKGADGLQLLPVSYAFHHDAVVFRTSPYGVLSELVRPVEVIFEVDDLDSESRTGWSVVVTGRAQAVAEPRDLVELWTIDGVTPLGCRRTDLLHRGDAAADHRPALRGRLIPETADKMPVEPAKSCSLSAVSQGLTGMSPGGVTAFLGERVDQLVESIPGRRALGPVVGDQVVAGRVHLPVGHVLRRGLG